MRHGVVSTRNGESAAASKLKCSATPAGIEPGSSRSRRENSSRVTICTLRPEPAPMNSALFRRTRAPRHTAQLAKKASKGQRRSVTLPLAVLPTRCRLEGLTARTPETTSNTDAQALRVACHSPRVRAAACVSNDGAFHLQRHCKCTTDEL